MTSIAERIAAIETEFAVLDQDARYTAIIERGRRAPPLDAAAKTDANRLVGCASAAWFTARLDQGRVRYAGQAEAIISNGLMALMITVYDDAPPAEILATPPAFIERLGLGASLSANRANGLASMAKQIKAYALAFGHLLAKQKPA